VWQWSFVPFNLLAFHHGRHFELEFVVILVKKHELFSPQRKPQISSFSVVTDMPNACVLPYLQTFHYPFFIHIQCVFGGDYK
jgi:hypothetical protein